MSKLLIEKQGAVTLLTLNRPEVHNNVDDELACLLADAIIDFGNDAAQSVLVIAGAGGVTFCAGANLKGMRELFEHRHTQDAGPMGFCKLDPGKPTIAAINGNCWAGGVELAVWCDIRIVDENARMGLLNKRWGLPLADGGTQRLPRLLGYGNALYMIETGMEIEADRALAMGLAQEVVDAGTAVDRALALAQHIAGYPQDGIRADRKAALATVGMSLEAGLELEVELCHAPSVAPQAMAGMDRFAKGARPEPPRQPERTRRGGTR
ncbi:MAG: enoyl-CoA hydratase-related protein [Gammaproteobacteria bacterium]|jgi:enoyl-CoA hydratase